MVFAALWLAGAVWACYLTSRSPASSSGHQVIMICAAVIVVSACAILMIDYSRNYENITDAIAILLFAAVVAVHIRIIRTIIAARSDGVR